jgi:hypothetical protein
MKLSPPASSSDIEAAREVARRLNQIATPAEPARPLPDYAPLKGTWDGTPVPPRRPGSPTWEASSTPVPPRPHPEPLSSAPPPVVIPPPSRTKHEIEHAAVLHEAPPVKPHVRETAPPPLTEAPPPPVISAPPLTEAATEPRPRYEVEPLPTSHPPAPVVAPPLSEPPRHAVPEPPPASVEEVEEIEEDMGPDEPDASIGAGVAAPMTWPEVVATCLSLAEAKGALVINPDGHVVAVSGEWPSPGAEAIAARLVPAMDKALKDAPTRSVSVPLGGLHLTAWRAPMGQGLVTVGFVADAPLRPDLRPAIDAAVKKGTEP